MKKASALLSEIFVRSFLGWICIFNFISSGCSSFKLKNKPRMVALKNSLGKHLELQLCKIQSLIQPYILFFLCQKIWKLSTWEGGIICISVACLQYKSYLLSLFCTPTGTVAETRHFLEGCVLDWGVICHLPSPCSLHINKNKNNKLISGMYDTVNVEGLLLEEK